MASISRLNQHIAALLASTSGFAVGVTLGWNSLAGLTLRTTIGWQPEEADLVVSVLAAGAVFGVLILVLLPRMCRAGSNRPFVFIALPPLVLGWALLCYTDYSYWHLMAGRILCGVALGALCTLVPLYIVETADEEKRDTLLLYFHLMSSSGLGCAFAIAWSVLLEDETELPLKRYSTECAVACVPALLCCLTPQSPLQRWLHSSEAESNDEVDAGREPIRKLAQALDEKKLEPLKTLRFWCNFVTTTTVVVLQQLSGASLIIFNALTLFDFAGSGRLTSGQLNLVCGLAMILTSMFATVLVSRLGRCVLFSISSLLMGIALILLGWFIKTRESDPEMDTTYSWMPPTWIGLYFGAYSLGVGPITWLQLADSFPIQLRVLTTSIISGIGWLLCFALNHQLRELLTNLGIPETLWLFAGFCLLGALLACCLVRETRGRSLTDIQEEFRIS